MTMLWMYCGRKKLCYLSQIFLISDHSNTVYLHAAMEVSQVRKFTPIYTNKMLLFSYITRQDGNSGTIGILPPSRELDTIKKSFKDSPV